MTDSRTADGEAGPRLSRRRFLVGATALGAAIALRGGVFVAPSGEVSLDPWVREEGGDPVPGPGAADGRHWLGPELWGNRLQDWRVADGRIECLRGAAGHELRTVGVLTRELVGGSEPGHLRARTGVIDGAGDGGFSGFLIGVGGGELDHEAAALAGRSSGGGGGTLCTYETDGQVRFREHTDEENPIVYESLPPDETLDGDAATPPHEGGVRLSLDLLPEEGDRVSLVLKAFDAATGDLVSGAVRTGVPEREALGGVSLVSSPFPGRDGARWWFDGFEASGGRIEIHPDRTFGPVAGVLYSLDGSASDGGEGTLKLSAHVAPVGDDAPGRVDLRYRPTEGGEWRSERSTIGDGHVALFRVDDWDATRAWDYRVGYRDADGETYEYDGRIPADPGEAGETTVGLVSCTIAGGRPLDETRPLSAYANPSLPGRYTPGNVYVPYPTLTRNLRTHDPDLLAFVGDQFYEWNPTRVESRGDPGLDYLYKWYLWLWSFRDLTRETPTIVLVDDHDVYQSNLWGEEGKRAPERRRSEAAVARGEEAHYDINKGGYVGSADFVNRAQRIQTGHNPDPYDPTPVDRDISVSYGAFTYGGTAFAFLEDRKFKIGPDVDLRSFSETLDPALLGDRQERFLAEWADERDAEAPAICLSQTILAAAQTTSDGRPRVDFDTNGFPKAGRDRAIRLLREAGALVLSGDQHLATLVRHGVDGRADGVVQFTGPAGGALFPRWFEPADPLPNRRTANTGDFADAFGNDVRVLAVANHGIGFRRFRREYRGPYIYHRELRSEGYGVVRVDHDDGAFAIECWPWDADPTDPDAQFDGWPYRLAFDEAGGAE